MSMERDIARDVKKNPKKFWKYANSKRKTKSGISELKTNTENGVKITENDRDKAEVLAEFYLYSPKLQQFLLMLLDVFHQTLEICLGLYLAVT
jgi:chromatin remodeling complex protein RSC6